MSLSRLFALELAILNVLREMTVSIGSRIVYQVVAAVALRSTEERAWGLISGTAQGTKTNGGFQTDGVL